MKQAIIKSKEFASTSLGRPVRMLALVAVLFAGSIFMRAADSSVKIQLDTSKTGPRVVESQTERAILRDYGFAWTNMSQALELNTVDPLQGLFVGTARKGLNDTVASQQRAGLSSRYGDQTHKLQAVFYAPEGDVIELHDTAEFQLQIMDGGKVVYDEHVVRHYVVLMTPGADRWAIRQLQAVPQF
jgi:hypothetical protein